ncbi:hypothetical protein GF407_11245 [candidate division KSB1 bacterium]|nr:hypothetical protein [candidate division KSB1 bacterium]
MQYSNRREFLKKSLIGATAIASSGYIGKELFAMPNISNSKISNKVIVLGIDGMDPNLLRKFMQKGEMPAFQRLVRSGHFGSLATTLPPQSPVAWSSFITGTNPGGHGIFDFIHRDPASFTPYLSTSRSYGAEKTLEIGKWSIPVKGGNVELLRRGPAFWTYLEEKGIPATLFKLPANFPVEDSKSKAISGMGTPDLLGTYGTFTFYTDMDIEGAKNFTGGRVVKVKPVDHVIKTKIDGPPNSLRTDQDVADIDFTVYRDPWEPVVKVDVQGQQIMLKQGEWSEWLPLKFEMMPMFATVNGMVKIYVQQVHPHFRMYVSPINVDPMEAHVPISNPSSYSRNLSEAVGRFYTQGFPEDTKALSNGIFSNEEFLSQSKMVLDERLEIFQHEFDDFNEGLFFFYFSSIDQNTHMMWRTMDPSHPLYEPNASKEVKDAVYYFYRSMDDVLKQAMDKADSKTTIMLLSDHGFAPFGREFHLSTWLVNQGYTAVTDPDRIHDSDFYDHVDWSKTKAFAMGLNGIYINLLGREVRGSVMPRDAVQLKKEIIEKLNIVRDPLNGKKMVAQAYDARKVYRGPFTDLAPDIVVGYQSGYRISDQAVLGKFPKGIVSDRKDKWSADHCMDPGLVPGTLITNQSVQTKTPGLWDLAPSILQKFGIQVPKEMDGKPIFG